MKSERITQGEPVGRIARKSAHFPTISSQEMLDNERKGAGWWLLPSVLGGASIWAYLLYSLYNM